MTLKILSAESQAIKQLFHFPVLIPFMFLKSENTFLENRVLGKPQMLPDMAQSIICGNDHLAVILMLLTEQNFHQGGFPMAVPAHQAHAFPGINLEADLVKKILSAEAF
jgi:hypothetical protein